MVDVMVGISQVLNTLNLSEALVTLPPLMVFVGVMVAYSVFIFKFYRFLASRDVFQVSLEDKYSKKKGEVSKFLHWVFYVLEYLLLFPLSVFFWSGVLFLFLAFLAKATNVANILLTATAVVAAVRVTAYYNEDLSRDLAKMLPFALLGIAVVDISFFSIENSLTVLSQAPGIWLTALHYLLFIVLVEFILRIGVALTTPFALRSEMHKKK